MLLLLKTLSSELVDHFNIGGRDPRTSDLPLVDSYPLVLLTIGIYILLVLKIGPKFMANRKPYNVKTIMQIYNIFQILMNLIIFCGLTKYFIQSPNFNLLCTKYDPTDNCEAVKLLRKYAYMYFINKIIDFMDTIFFILRKKFNQVTFLHVYHHASMVLGVFVYLNLLYGSEFTILGIVNSLVHVLMYTYYFLSASNMNLKLDSLKPYVTLIQILQFTIFSVKFFLAFVNDSWCEISNFWLAVLIIQNFNMTVMFSHFYIKTYTANNAKKSKTKK